MQRPSLKVASFSKPKSIERIIIWQLRILLKSLCERWYSRDILLWLSFSFVHSLFLSLSHAHLLVLSCSLPFAFALFLWPLKKNVWFKIKTSAYENQSGIPPRFSYAHDIFFFSFSVFHLIALFIARQRPENGACGISHPVPYTADLDHSRITNKL